jgi:hypothetical protein
LRLPDDNQPALRTAIAPMVEDMQIAVGCDGYVSDSPELAALALPAPEAGREEDDHGGKDAANNIIGPNFRVDEWIDDPQNDEWWNNASDEQWTPDCVIAGTGELNAAVWAGAEGVQDAYYRLRPELVRITLIGKSETDALSADQDSDPADPFWDGLAAIEDRALIQSVPGLRGRDYQTLTERFRPANLGWRYPHVP